MLFIEVYSPATQPSRSFLPTLTPLDVLCSHAPGDLKLLRVATEDALHQPIRGAKAYPHLFHMIRAAMDAGAHGCFLSGAGPTVLAFCSGAAGDIFAQKSDERQEQVRPLSC